MSIEIGTFLSLPKDLLEAILNRFGKTPADFQVFIETGTHCGNSLWEMKDLFPDCHSIELSVPHYEYCLTKFQDIPNVKLHHGESIAVLPSLLDQYKKGIVFFLDGHYSGGDTAKGTKDFPILEEVQLISGASITDSIIIIDDYNLFPKEGFHKDQLKDALRSSTDGIVCERKLCFQV